MLGRMADTANRALKKSTLIAIIASGCVAMLLATVLFQGVIRATANSGAFGPQPTTTVVDGEYIAFELEAPDNAMSSSYVGTEEGCDYVHYRMTNFRLTVKALKKDCEVPDDQEIRNGNHGSYKTLDDVPDPIGVEKVDTGLGPAQVFTQKYSEYTNESNHYDEPTAIVTFDTPVNPDFPTMVVYSAKAELDREAFTAIVEKIRPPHS